MLVGLNTSDGLVSLFNGISTLNTSEIIILQLMLFIYK